MALELLVPLVLLLSILSRMERCLLIAQSRVQVRLVVLMFKERGRDWILVTVSYGLAGWKREGKDWTSGRGRMVMWR